MAENVKLKNTGLRGVVVADTKVSYVDGEQGILIYRGYRIEDLAERSSFPETAYLLLMGELPDAKELAGFEREIEREREIPEFLYEALSILPKSASSMDMLQAVVPMLSAADPDSSDEGREANTRKAIRLIARIPVLVAGWHRIRNGLEPLPSDPGLSHAGNFLWQLHGRRPSPGTARDLDICLILHADHTFNASTFACREVVSTGANIYAGVAAGLGALSGPLHGGANSRVMEMLFELQSGRDIADWIRRRLDRKERIMGIGHAIYKTVDPRAIILKEMSGRLAEETGERIWYDLSLQVEEAALQELRRRGKSTLKPNVDFYSASVYHMMGIPGNLMTPVFAISRVAGWCTHIIEEKFAEAQERPALYRPDSEYVGNYCGRTGCIYTPIEEREHSKRALTP